MKDKNNIYAKPAYKCALCEEVYDSVQARANCEMACLKKQQEEERKATEAKKKAEKDARHAEVIEALKTASNLLGAYEEDYGPFEYEGNSSYIWPSRLWHYFW